MVVAEPAAEASAPRPIPTTGWRSSRGALSHLPGWIATGAGLGLLRPAPGTWASLATGLLAIPLLPLLPWWGMPALALILAAVGVWSAEAEAHRCNRKDPSWVVIDEIAGMAWGLALIPTPLAAAQPLLVTGLVFCWFRCYDIAKPWPLNRLEHLPGGWGIMADDLAAGLLAGVLTTALLP
jgi:phosphatidylglycerophosphatase A